MKYKVGDKVRVRKDIDDSTAYYMDDKSDYFYAILEMIDGAGSTVTIAEATPNWYRIEEDKTWKWTDEMFEDIEDLVESVEVNACVIPTKPIVVIPVCSDTFIKHWMENFVKRNGGEPVNGSVH